MLWYPYVQMKNLKKPYKVTAAKGAYLQLDGKWVLDTTSSWWSVIHGYNHPELNKVLTEQIEHFSHVMLGGLTHEPAEHLANKLAEILPGNLNHSFFSDSGSVAVEVALKMALQFYLNRGEKRTKVLSLTHSYHGDTFKTMEVGDDEEYHFVLNAYGKSPNVIHINPQIDELRQAFAVHHAELNCLIVEPLLQGAGGMRMYDQSFLQVARELCNQYDVLLIFDEVATGFGRTGHRFVADIVEPDIIVLGKALTAGYIGHAVTVANDRVFYGFYADSYEQALMHGPTFMGNPLACSVALKSIELFEQNDYLSKIKDIERIFRRELDDFKHRSIIDIRIMGGCACIEVEDASILEGYQDYAMLNQIFARPFLNYLYAMVPYIVEEKEIIKITDIMKNWFNRLA